MTIKIVCALSADLVDSAETCLLELEYANWSLTRDIEARGNYELQGFFEDTENIEIEKDAIIAIIPALASAHWSVITLEETDWQDAYKAYLKPWSTDTLHWVPTWEKENYNLPENHVCLLLDAGMAFGTGAHETTRLCAERLLHFSKNNSKDDRVIDAGCGSGILALSASLLGHTQIEAFDIDPNVIAVCEENAAFNELENRVQFSVNDLASGLKDKQAGLILANIQSHILCPQKEKLLQAVQKGGTLVLSGILEKEISEVKKIFEVEAKKQWGSYTSDSRNMGEWSDLELKRPNL